MSKTNEFACFADAADQAEEETTTILSQKTITVKQLMEALQKMVQKDASSEDAVVLQVEFGGLVTTRNIELNDGKLIFGS